MPFLDTSAGRDYLQNGASQLTTNFSPFCQLLDEQSAIAAVTAGFSLGSINLPTMQPRAGQSLVLPPTLDPSRVNEFAKALTRVLDNDPAPFDSHAPTSESTQCQ